MSLTYRCPDCKTVITYTPDMADELTACPGCQELVKLPARGAGQSSSPPMPTMGPLPIPGTGPIPLPKTGQTAAPPPVPKTSASNVPPAIPKTTVTSVPAVPKTTMSEPPAVPPRPSRSTAPPAVPKTTASAPPADDFSNLDRPARRRPRDPEPERKSGNTGLFVAVGVVGFLLVAGAVGAVVVLMMQQGDDKGKDKVAKNDDKDTKDRVVKNDDKGTPPKKENGKKDYVGSKDGGPPPKDNGKGPTTTPPDGPNVGAALTPDQVYKRLLRSTAFISTGGGRGAGSGALVDRKEGLVLTNHHVIAGSKRVMVFFPEYEGNDLQTSPGYYLDRESTLGVPAEVVADSPINDLALLKLSRVPPGRTQVRISRKSTEPGETVLSIGASGIEFGRDGRSTEGHLWRSTKGSVSLVTKKEAKFPGQVVNCWCVETDSQINPGDSGGPVADNRCRLVAVVSYYRKDKRGVTTFIDVREVLTLLEKHLGRALDSDEDLPEPGDSNQLPTLRLALRSGDANGKRDAVRKMGAMGPDAQEAVPDLLDAWGKADPRLATDIGTALEIIGPPNVADIDVLREALKGDRREGKLYALNALDRMGRKGDKALPELMAVCADKDNEIRALALKTLPVVGSPEKPGLVRTLVDGLRDERQIVKLAAMSGLHKVGPTVRREVYEPVINVLADPDLKVQEAAQAVIAGLGKVTEDDIDVFRRALSHPGIRVRVYAAVCLSDLGKKSLPALPELSKAITDSDPDVRKMSINAVSQLGRSAAPAVSSLIAALSDSEVPVRVAAATTLGAVGREPGVYPALLTALTDKQREVKAAAASAFKDVGKPLEQDVPEVIKRLSHDEALVRTFAAEGLGKLDVGAKAAWPELVRLATKDKSVRVRLAAVAALAEGGASAREHAGALATALGQKVEPGPDDKDLPMDRSEPAAPPAGGGASAEAYRKLISSGVWLAAERGFSGRVTSSGFLVDSRNRLVVTSARVATGRGQQVAVFPPRSIRGKIIDDPNDYLLKATRVGFLGQVVEADPSRDLALVRLPVLPPGIRALAFAGTGPKAGDPAHALGTDGANANNGGGSLFQYKTDAVEAVAERTDFIGFRRLTGRMVETKTLLHPQDSGGPVVNAKGELIAMRIGYNRAESAMGLEASEILAWVKAVSARTLVPFIPATAEAEEAAANPLASGGKSVTAEMYREALLKALRKIGLEDEKAMKPVADLLTSADAKVRSAALSLLAPMGVKLRPQWQAIFKLAEIGDDETKKTADELLAKMGDAKLVDDLHNIALRSARPAEMLTAIRVMGGSPAKADAKRLLNRIAENTGRRYPPEVRSAAKSARDMITD